MAYADNSPIKLIAGRQGGSNGIWFYDAGTDAWSTVDGAEYFNAEVDRLKVGDVIFGVANDVAGMVMVASNDGTDVDTTNTEFATDSD